MKQYLTKANLAKAFGVAVVLATAFGIYSPEPATAPAKCVPCACDAPAPDAGAQ